MPSSKASKRWVVNILSFVLFVILSFTGLINWLLLPTGNRGGGGTLISLRHFLRQIHEWTALLFIIVVLVHLLLHWSYINLKLKESRRRKSL